MNYHEAQIANVSPADAIRELANHGFEATLSHDGLAIICDGERVAESVEGSFLGSDILDWLGY